jgi:hypothetical protein
MQHMARKELVILTDDLDNSEIDPAAVDRPTVRFGIDGAEYEIDLGSRNQAALREILAEYVESGRRTGGSVRKGRRPAVAAPTSTSSRAENAAIREWAEASGIDVNSRGRLPKEVIERYRGHFSEQNDDGSEAAPADRPAPNKDQPAFSG